MSLTSHLRSSASPVRDFFSKHFPNTKELVKEFNDKIKAKPLTTLPAVPVSDSGLIGTAFDYRARFYLDNYDPHDTIAFREGATDFLGWGNKRALLYELFSLFDKDTWMARPTGRRLSSAQESQLNLNCLILGFFEQYFRAKHRILLGGSESTAISLLRRARTAEGLRKTVRRDYSSHIAEMGLLSRRFFDDIGPLMKKAAILNPTFEGSSDVDGADGDFILGRTLYELKTSRVERPFTRELFWQLLGYVLLDYGDKYRICRVGVYFPRRGFHHEWKLADFIDRLSLKPKPLGEWRRKFSRIKFNSFWFLGQS